ncbi:endonuclease/exonuclease/phosphatase family protein [Sphingobacterium corticis]|uniref:Endonuclease/exonuclease/phosphatase family protein n=1 Tax=Sphingobacterium corticis TaxID=1812823 RepID=A0ABW5NGR9_9SPHI
MNMFNLLVEKTTQVMAWTNLFIPVERWRLLIVMISVIAIVLWYMFNFKRATARSNYIFESDYELTESRSGTLNLLTYNIAGLPELISSAKTPRAESIRSIGHKMDRFDLVNVQEDFNYNADLYHFNQHRFRTVTKGKVPFGDGLNTLSKYPILEVRRIPWDHCNGSDCLTPKGFAYMCVQIAKDVFIDVYNMHATSHISKAALQARSNNMQQLAAYIKTHSEGNAVIVMGDFNAHYTFVGDNMHDFKKQTGLIDPWVDIFLKGKIPQPFADFMIPHKLELTDEMESIDKILYRHGKGVRLSPGAYAIEDDLFSTETGDHLSDHLAISLKLDWELIDETENAR